MAKASLRIVLVIMVIGVTVGCDQSTKIAARRLLKDRGTVYVLGDFLVLRYVENQGAFLGLGTNCPE